MSDTINVNVTLLGGRKLADPVELPVPSTADQLIVKLGIERSQPVKVNDRLLDAEQRAEDELPDNAKVVFCGVQFISVTVYKAPGRRKKKREETYELASDKCSVRDALKLAGLLHLVEGDCTHAPILNGEPASLTTNLNAEDVLIAREN